ncbi:Gfo/Idh/MocA family oxidoreductase [Thalassoglobus sp. JC818]|uniref:Gfo/Idh/MocA family oxidoreductase n=1 Tax=Thalassoglobus sp. JC818 TaxID=3232136 RepID=UPI003457B491
MNGTLKLAVIGVGALGRHHARILSEMEGVELIAVADPNEKQGRSVAESCGCNWTNDYRTLIKSVDAVSVVVPTFLHKQVGGDFLSKDVPVLMEKPLAGNVEDGEALVRLADEHSIPLQVGHIERFNPAFQEIADWTGEPKYIRTERVSPYAFRSMDIGVVHDLMIHDIELCLSLTQEMPTRVEAFGASLVGGREDAVQARLYFPNGCIADLTVNRVSPTPSRNIQCWSETGCATADLTTRIVKKFSPTPMMQSGQFPFDLAQSGERTIDELKTQVFGTFIEPQEVQASNDDALTAELTSFIDAVRHRHRPIVNGRDALAALRVAETVLECVESHCWDGTKEGRVGPSALLKFYSADSADGSDSAAA